MTSQTLTYAFPPLAPHQAGTSIKFAKLLGRLVTVIYWLLILEGILRKWVVPELSRPLFFIRDPLVIAIYIAAFRYQVRAKSSIFLLLGTALAIVTIPLTLVQYAFSSEFDWLIVAYGWRNYFLYIPLAFLIAKFMPMDAIRRLIRWTLIASIPIAILVYFQFLSPPRSPINQGFGKTAETQFTNDIIAGGVVRTYGTFTSSPGQGAFTITSLGMLLAVFMNPYARLRIGRVALIFAAAAIFSCLAMSGSRGAVVWASIVFISAICAGIVTVGRRGTLRIFAIPILIASFTLPALPAIFPKAFDSFSERWRTADQIETENYGQGGIFARATYEMLSFRFLLSDTPLQGYQLGVGGNAAVTLNLANNRTNLEDKQNGAAESDWGRQITELGPILGIAFILFRVSFVLWLAGQSLRATRRSGDALPMLMFSFVGVLLFNGQITGHGSLNGYAWLFVGFLMAINQASGKRLPESSQRAYAALPQRPNLRRTQVPPRLAERWN